MAFRTSQFYRTGSNLTFSGQYLFTFICFCAVLFQKNRKKTAQRIIVTRKIAKKLQGTTTHSVRKVGGEQI